MLAIFVGLIEIGLGLGKLGFVADLLSKEVQVGYMNGLGITIIVGQLPKLFGFSTDADSFLDELKAFVEGLGQTHAATLVLGLAVLAILLVLPLITKRLPAILVAVVGATVGLGGLRPRRPRGRDGRVPAPGSAHPRTALDERRRRTGAAAGGARHHPGLADRHDRDRDQLRGPARGRGQARPGDDRHRRGEHGRRLLPGVRGLDQRLEDRGRRAVGGKDPAGRPGRRRARRGPPALPQLAARRPAAGGARGRRHRRGAVADEPAAAAPLLRDAQKRARRVSGRHRRSRAPRRPAGNRGRGPAGDHPLLPPQLVAARRGPGTPAGTGGMARPQRLPRRRGGGGRRRLPLGGAAVLRQLGQVPRRDQAARTRARAALDRPAVRGRSPTST